MWDRKWLSSITAHPCDEKCLKNVPWRRLRTKGYISTQMNPGVHCLQVFHRDIKCPNILLVAGLVACLVTCTAAAPEDRNGTAKIADFAGHRGRQLWRVMRSRVRV